MAERILCHAATKRRSCSLNFWLDKLRRVVYNFKK